MEDKTLRYKNILFFLFLFLKADCSENKSEVCELAKKLGINHSVIKSLLVNSRQEKSSIRKLYSNDPMYINILIDLLTKTPKEMQQEIRQIKPEWDTVAGVVKIKCPYENCPYVDSFYSTRVSKSHNKQMVESQGRILDHCKQSHLVSDE